MQRALRWAGEPAGGSGDDGGHSWGNHTNGVSFFDRVASAFIALHLFLRATREADSFESEFWLLFDGNRDRADLYCADEESYRLARGARMSGNLTFSQNKALKTSLLDLSASCAAIPGLQWCDLAAEPRLRLRCELSHIPGVFFRTAMERTHIRIAEMCGVTLRVVSAYILLGNGCSL